MATVGVIGGWGWGGANFLKGVIKPQEAQLNPSSFLSLPPHGVALQRNAPESALAQTGTAGNGSLPPGLAEAEQHRMGSYWFMIVRSLSPLEP